MGGCVQSLLTRAKNKDFHVLDKPAKNRKPIGCLEITFSHTFEITLEHFLSPARVSLLSGRCLTLFRGTKCTHDSAGLEFIFDRVPGAGNSFLRVTVAKNVLTPTHWGLALPGVHDFRRVFSLPVRFVR